MENDENRLGWNHISLSGEKSPGEKEEIAADSAAYCVATGGCNILCSILCILCSILCILCILCIILCCNRRVQYTVQHIVHIVHIVHIMHIVHIVHIVQHIVLQPGAMHQQQKLQYIVKVVSCLVK